MTRDHIEAAAGWAVIFGLFFAFWIVTPAHAAEPWPRWSSHDGAAYAFAAVIIVPTVALLLFCALAKWTESRNIEDRHEHIDGEVP